MMGADGKQDQKKTIECDFRGLRCHRYFKKIRNKQNERFEEPRRREFDMFTSICI